MKHMEPIVISDVWANSEWFSGANLMNHPFLRFATLRWLRKKSAKKYLPDPNGGEFFMVMHPMVERIRKKNTAEKQTQASNY